MAYNLTTELSTKTKSVKINRDQPTIIIGEKVIVGFKEKEIKEALGL